MEKRKTLTEERKALAARREQQLADAETAGQLRGESQAKAAALQREEAALSARAQALAAAETELDRRKAELSAGEEAAARTLAAAATAAEREKRLLAESALFPNPTLALTLLAAAPCSFFCCFMCSHALRQSAEWRNLNQGRRCFLRNMVVEGGSQRQNTFMGVDNAVVCLSVVLSTPHERDLALSTLS